jgi:transposase-like protein
MAEALEAVRQAAPGKNVRQIADALGIPSSTLFSWLQKAVPAPSSDAPTEEQKQRAQEALDAGSNIWTVALGLGVHPKTLRQWLGLSLRARVPAKEAGKSKKEVRCAADQPEIVQTCCKLLDCLEICRSLLRCLKLDISRQIDRRAEPNSSFVQGQELTLRELLGWVVAKFREARAIFDGATATQAPHGWLDEIEQLGTVTSELLSRADLFENFCRALHLETENKQLLAATVQRTKELEGEISDLILPLREVGRLPASRQRCSVNTLKIFREAQRDFGQTGNSKSCPRKRSLCDKRTAARHRPI